MPGMMRRKYNSETGTYMKSFTSQLNKIADALPREYDKEILLSLYKEFYPIHWGNLIQRYEYYSAKDEHLVKIGKKRRYYHKSPENFFYSLLKVKLICSNGYKLKHKKDYNEDQREKAERSLASQIKKPKQISRDLQFTDPYHLDIFISAYHKKGITQHQKMEIVKELIKYKTKATITFFQKLNDSERNNQIREISFKHLQSIDAYARKRKNFKGKIKDYNVDTDDFIVTPLDLANKIKKRGIQSKQKFDFFISHSYKDNKLVTELKNELNNHNLSIYCDWTSDNDFLKRNLVSEYTEIVLKERINQSNLILFLQTSNSVDDNREVLSEWVKMELDHSLKNNKKIFCINRTSHSPLFCELISNKSDDKEFNISDDEIKKIKA